MTASGAGLPSNAPTTGQPSGPRPTGPPEWLSSSHVRAIHRCIVYERTRSEPSCDFFWSHVVQGRSERRTDSRSPASAVSPPARYSILPSRDRKSSGKPCDLVSFPLYLWPDSAATYV